MKIRHILDSLGRDLRPANIALLIRQVDGWERSIGAYTVLDHLDSGKGFVLRFMALHDNPHLVEVSGYYCEDLGYFNDYSVYKLAEGKSAL